MNDLKGNKYNRLTVIGYNHESRKYICKCDCGNIHEVNKYNLTHGLVKSCGCLFLEGNNKKHGCRHTRLYMVWKGMRCRCYTKTSSSFRNYGARGISICDEWNDYKKFKEWAETHGYQEGLQIDRIDVNGNYEPSNCRWVGVITNANNKRNNRYIEYNGIIKTMSEWAREYNIKPATLWARLNKGWSVEKALSQKVVET